MDDLTFAIPFQNSATTLPAVFLSCFSQGLDPKVILCDNGSVDGSRQMFDFLLKGQLFSRKNTVIIETKNLAAGRKKNISFARYHLCQAVKSEYIFLLDSDVLLPPFVVSDMLEFLKSSKNIGCLGLRCEPRANHVQFGCCLMRSSIAKQIQWQQSHTQDGTFHCECWHAQKDLEALNLSVEYYPDSQARHLKYF